MWLYVLECTTEPERFSRCIELCDLPNFAFAQEDGPFFADTNDWGFEYYSSRFAASALGVFGVQLCTKRVFNGFNAAPS